MQSRILPLIITIGGFGMLLGALIFGAESLFWLKQGVWPDWSMAAVCDCRAATTYVGLNKILNWYLDASLSGATFFTSAALFGLSCYATQDT